MPARVRVFARVPVWRTVATQGDATFLAGPQVDPLRPDLYAFFAFATMRLLDRLNRDRIQMRTPSRIHDRLVGCCCVY